MNVFFQKWINDSPDNQQNTSQTNGSIKSWITKSADDVIFLD